MKWKDYELIDTAADGEQRMGTGPAGPADHLVIGERLRWRNTADARYRRSTRSKREMEEYKKVPPKNHLNSFDFPSVHGIQAYGHLSGTSCELEVRHVEKNPTAGEEVNLFGGMDIPSAV